MEHLILSSFISAAVMSADTMTASHLSDAPVTVMYVAFFIESTQEFCYTLSFPGN